MFEVNVKNVTREGRGPAQVWGSDIGSLGGKQMPLKMIISTKNSVIQQQQNRKST